MTACRRTIQHVLGAAISAVVVSQQCAAPLHGQGTYRTFEKVQTIGSVDGAPEYTFGTLADAAFSPDGSILALDAGNSLVRVYDRTGRYLRSLGRSGAGPGELQYPTKLIVAHDRIRVLDPAQSRYVEFRSDGTHVETRRVGDGVPFSVVIPVRHGHSVASSPNSFTVSGAFVRLASECSPTIQREGRVARDAAFEAVALVRAGEARLDTLFRFDHGMVLYVANRGVGTLRYTFGAQGGWALAGDSMLATVDGFSGTVRLLEFTPSGARPVWTSQAGITPQPLSLRDMESLADLHWSGRQKPASYELLGPTHKPGLGKPIMATNGDVWVPRVDIDPRRRATPSEKQYVIVPRSGSQQLARFPASSEVMAVDGDMVLVRILDEWGVAYLELWRQSGA